MLVLKLCEQLCPDKIPVKISNKLGDGADGEVFDIEGEPDKVIKFCVLYQTGPTKVEKTYKSICKTLDYIVTTPAPTYANVYSHEYMGAFTRKVTWGEQPYIIYNYIMEKLQKITEDEKRVFHSLVSHEDRGIKKDFSAAQRKEMISGMGTCLDFDAEKVMFFCDNFRNTQISHLDIHVRNIMKDSAGNFKLIDFDRVEIDYGK